MENDKKILKEIFNLKTLKSFKNTWNTWKLNKKTAENLNGHKEENIMTTIVGWLSHNGNVYYRLGTTWSILLGSNDMWT